MITILVATYNGEKYIREQLDSLLNQTVKEINIVICDDKSTDNTFSILKEYESKYSKKIKVVRNEVNTGSAKHNFFKMILENKDDYVMMCDQDDVWKKDKVEVTLNKMKELELKHGNRTPILVHTDLTVVDKDLNVISESYKYRMKANFNKTKLNNVIIQNIAAGCTTMINRSLCEIIREPKYCVMHDWWLVLVASAFGIVDHVDRSTIYYRQHGANEVGSGNIRSFKYRFKRLINNKDIKKAVNETYDQCENLIDTYKDKLSDNQIKLLENYISIPSKNKISKIRTIYKYDFHKNTFTRRIAHILFI